MIRSFRSEEVSVWKEGVRRGKYRGKPKTSYEMRISDWSSDVCSSDLHPMARSVARMAAQEEQHRIHFDRMITRRGVRPTLLAPLWDRAGFALGAVTAAIGPEAAMACTAAIETEIDRHYDQQLQELGDEDPELTDAIDRKSTRLNSSH